MREYSKFLAPILILALFLSACSGVKLFYSLIDDFIWDSVEFHLDLEAEGEEDFTRRKVEELVDWHRDKMLSVYARHLNEQAVLLEQGPMGRDRLEKSFAEGRVLILDTVKGAIPFAAMVLVRHRWQERRNYFRDRMKERMEEQLEGLSEPWEERLEERIERIVDNFERFTGDLNDQQLKIIENHAAKNIEYMAYRLANRQLRQQAFIGFLAANPDEAAIAGYIERLLLRPYEIVQPEYQEISARAIARFKDMLFKIVMSLTSQQRQKAAATLRSYAAAFVGLSS